MAEFGSAKFVGLSGLRGAGKDAGAIHLEQNHGFLHISTGDLVRDEARRRGLDIERQTLIDLGIQMRQEYQSVGALVLKSMELWQDDADRYPGGLVVSGMRSVGEAQTLVDNGGHLIFVEAQLEVRHRRIARRQRDSEATQSLKDFANACFIEEHGDITDPTRSNLSAVRKLARTKIYNDFSTPEPFLRELDYVLGLPQDV